MSPSKAIDSSDAVTPWTADGSTLGRVVRVLEQVVVSDYGASKRLEIDTACGGVAIVLDQAAADHLANLLRKKAA